MARSLRAWSCGFALAAVVRVGLVDRGAGAMMLPYAGWVGFATALNAAIWRRN